MDSIRLLIIDKDEVTRITIKRMAAVLRYSYDEAADGIAALKLFRRHDYDIIIMDPDLPELDGKNVCRQIRKVSDVPILITCVKCSEEDKLSAFELGADDYIVKPFFPQELFSRIRVFLHRTGTLARSMPTKMAFGGLLIDTRSRVVYVDDRIVQLTPKEYNLLFFLSQNPNKAFSRETLLNEVWGHDFIGSDRTVDTHVRTLRENIKPYDSSIATVWGFGYKFVV